MANQSALSLYADTPEGERAVQEYRDQQKMLMDSLVNRKQLFDPTLLAISQALGAPTRTGSFGEVIGNVAGAIGPVQQAEEKRSQDIAKMRFDMAQQNLQSQQTTSTDRAFKELISRNRPTGTPPALGSITTSGEPNVAPSAGPNAATPSTVAQGRSITSEDIARLASMPGGVARAKILQDMISQDRDRYKINENFIIDIDAPGGPKPIADLRAGKQEPTEIVVGGKSLFVNMTPTEGRDFQAAYAQGKGDEFYKKNLEGRRTDVNLPSAGGALQEIYVPLLGETRFMGTARQAANIEKLSEEAIKTGNPTALKAYVDSITKQMAMPAASAAPAAPSVAPAAQGQPPAARPPQPAPQAAQQPAQPVVSDLSGLPLAEQNKIISDRLAKSDTPAQETATILQTTATPQSISSSNRRLTEIQQLVADNPNVVGLMNEQGLMAALQTAANEGLRVGNYTVSLPVKSFIEKIKLDPDQQTTARRIAMLLDEEFFNRAALAKSALGPQISNADSILMKSPMARPEDSAKLIGYWSLHGKMVNRQNEELHKAFNQWLDQTKGRSPVRQFFNKEGRVIMDKYTPYFERLQKGFGTR